VDQAVTQEELSKLKQDTEERRDRLARQFHDDVGAVLATGGGRRLWVLIRYEFCGLDNAPLDRIPGLRAVATALDRALLPYPEIAASIVETRADIDKSQAFYQAGMHRLKESING
jgi:hypothetical protein